MNRPKRVTIFDVATHLGISHTTVSRALNGNPRVKEATRRKIIKVAHEMGYVPNQNARGLNQGRTYTIGLFFTDLQNGTSALFLTSIILNIRSQLPENYFISINSISNTEKLGFFDGAIVVSQSKQDRPFIDELVNMHIPVVVLNRKFESDAVYNYYLDNYGSSKAMTQHALLIGCQNLGIIRGKLDYTSTYERSRGFFDGISEWSNNRQDANLFIHPPVEGEYTALGGYTAMKYLLDDVNNLPDYVFVENDDMAIGALRAISEQPQLDKSIKISGFDDTEMASFSVPKLTTVHSPILEMTTLGVSTLNQLLNNKENIDAPVSKKFEMPIMYRESLPK